MIIIEITLLRVLTSIVAAPRLHLRCVVEGEEDPMMK